MRKGVIMKEKKTTSTGDFVGTTKAPAKEAETKNNKKKSKGPGIFKRMGAKWRDVISELKKVSWPSFGKVVKQTGVVLAVVIVFLVVITAFDTGLSELLKLINPVK